MFAATGNRGKGFELRATPATASPAAPLARAAAVGASLSDFNLSVTPRSFVDQGDVDCCVSCALAYAMEVVHPDWPALAPLFHNYVSRFINGSAGVTGGLALSDALTTLTKQGICRHEDHDVDHGAPYTPDEASIRPSEGAFADALGRRIPFGFLGFQYRHLNGSSLVAAIREELRQMRPVVAGFRLPQDYPSGFLDARFEWTDPTKPLALLGHCVYVSGYSDTRQALRVRDSQGSGRFDSGGWWMGYRVADSGIVEDAYSLIP